MPLCAFLLPRRHVPSRPSTSPVTHPLVALSVRDLRMRQNFGRHSQREVEEKLAALGLSLGMALDGSTYADAVTAALIATLRAATNPAPDRIPLAIRSREMQPCRCDGYSPSDPNDAPSGSASTFSRSATTGAP